MLPSAFVFNPQRLLIGRRYPRWALHLPADVYALPDRLGTDQPRVLRVQGQAIEGDDVLEARGRPDDSWGLLADMLPRVLVWVLQGRRMRAEGGPDAARGLSGGQPGRTGDNPS